MLLPEGTTHVKQFSIPKAVFFFFAFILLSFAISLLWLISDYMKIKAEMPQLAYLEMENNEKETELGHLKERIHQMNVHIGEIKKLNNSLNLVASMGVMASEKYGPLQGVGGSESAQFMLDDAKKKNNSRINTKSVKKEESRPTGPHPPGTVLSAEKMDSLAKTLSSDHTTSTDSPDKSGAHPYSVMVGSYRSIERAKNAISNNRAKGFSSYWVKVDLGEKGLWFRVFAGHFKTWKDAENFRKDKGLTHAMVKKTQYANLIACYSTEPEVTEKISLLKKSGYFPYVIKDNQDISKLYVGAFLTKAGAALQYNDLMSHGFQNQIANR